tara:strand:+ start:158 stop:550 length:393 start_codon:yes stop_codon:yes gene_type:complete
MAIRKNKKRIDPRYFLNETTYRDLDEQGDKGQGKLDTIGKLLRQSQSTESDPNGAAQARQALEQQVTALLRMVNAGGESPGNASAIAQRILSQLARGPLKRHQPPLDPNSENYFEEVAQALIAMSQDPAG